MPLINYSIYRIKELKLTLLKGKFSNLSNPPTNAHIWSLII